MTPTAPSGVKPSKRELTRSRVILAAVDCIYEVGFNAAHTNRIADAAGVSWGVLQYHFGDKDGLLQAVLDHIFNEFSATLAASAIEGEDLEQRLNHVIEVVWSLVSKKEYRVSLAILRNAGKDEASAINGQAQISRWSDHVTALWNNLFADNVPQPQQSEVALRLMFASLRGMADEINPSSRSQKTLRQERQALARALVSLLAES